LVKFNFTESEWIRKVKSLSGGEKTRLALAKIILQKPNMLVLDEPTNHLDLDTINWLENFLVNWSGAIVAISHDKRFLDLVCDKTFELQKNCLEKYYCNYSGYLEERKDRGQRKAEEFKRQEKYLGKQNEFIERFRYKATKARAVQSRIKMLDKIDKIEEPKENRKKVKIRFNISKRLPQKVLEFSDLFIGGKDFPLAAFEGKWTVEKDNKIGIIGPNGAGKSTFLKTLVGKSESIEGKIKISAGVKIGYYAQAHEELDPKKNILEEVEFKVREKQEKIRTVLGALLFSGEDVFKKISDLSGGERARVALAELILSETNMLILDEPTNHLDLESKGAIIEVLKSFTGPIIIVSHDRSVLSEACNIIWEIKNNEVRAYLGNYEDYEERKKQL
jgi:ATP-binding cassette, subfamily F, member 3